LATYHRRRLLGGAGGAGSRGYGTIIGSFCSLEHNCAIHARPGERTVIGDWVMVGHGAIIRKAQVRDYAVSGMGSVVSDWAQLGRWAVVGEGAVVRQRQTIDDEQIAVRVPARLLEKKISDAYKAQWAPFKETYVDLARRYPKGCVPPASSDCPRLQEPVQHGSGLPFASATTARTLPSGALPGAILALHAAMG
jgi:carbonic anhydrase/acetyltransferase-like protein (isoleucine patch superfamily)